MAILTSLALDDPTPPKEVNRHCPQALSELIMSMLAKKLDLRPASAELVAARLATFDAQGSDTLVSTHRVVTGESLAIPTGSSRGPRAGTRRRGIGLVAVGLVMISGVFGLVFQGAIYRTATNRGELLVDVDDAGVSVEILHDGAVVGERSTRRDFTLPAGKGEIEFIDVDGRPLLRRPFALGRNGTATVRMTSEELSDARKSLNFDKIDPGEAAAARRAAERILSVGGVVGITDANRQFREVADLPLLPDPFRLVGVSLHDNHLVSDNDLEALKDCRNLIYLDLVATNIGDAGLANLKDCKELADLRLGITGVGDAGLANFKGCQKLRVLDLNGTRATDAGLANFRDCPNLTDLALGIPGITDVGAGYFAGRTGIALLNLAGTDITDAGFAFFKDCTNITVLHLENTRLSDASLAYFQNCQGLTRATFQGTQITDDGLAHLKNCKKLRQLSLQDTKVTATGVEELGKALPQCRIEWDGRVIEPRSADK
jgi:hypothetical protein